MRAFPFPFPRAPKNRGKRNRESASERVAGSVSANTTSVDERSQRVMERRVPDLAELAERGRGDRHGGGGEVLDEPLLEAELGRDDRGFGAGGALLDRAQCDDGARGVEREVHTADRRGGAVLDGQGELL